MVYCVAFGCSNNSNSGGFTGSFYHFPKTKKLRKAWTLKINRADFNPDEYYQGSPYLCSEHFAVDCFDKNPEIARACGIRVGLKKNAVPTIFKRRTEGESAAPKRRKSNSTLKRQNQELIAEHDRTTTETRPMEEWPVLVEPRVVDEEPLDRPTNTETKSLLAVLQEHTENSLKKKQDAQCQVNIAIKEKNRCYSRGFQTEMKVSDIQTAEERIQALEKREVELLARMKELEAVINEDSEELDEELDEDMSTIMGAEEEMPSDPQLDPDWHKTMEDIDSDSEEEDEDDVNDRQEQFGNGGRRFIVDESQLEELMSRCSTCMGPCEVFLQRRVGCGITLVQKCTVGHRDKWDSQPPAPGRKTWMPLGNIILACAIFFSAASPVKAINMFAQAGIATFSMRTYFRIQKFYLIPAVLHVWRRSQALLIQQLQTQGAFLGGDARCCSPGHTAKYGSYTLMDMKLVKVVDMQLIQSNEVNNSYGMELEGLKRGIADMKERNITIHELTTDRHSSVKKYMREEQPEIRHWFDVWHCAKGVYKKLEALSKKKGCKDVAEWAQSISNHLYWCAASSGGDGVQVLAKWLSVLNHIVDKHTGHGPDFPACEHGDIDDREWILAGSKIHKEIESIVASPFLCKDIKRLSPYHQTSVLESFHKIICYFAPKALHFFFPAMRARLYLACLHFNENSERKQAETKDGKLQFSVSFPKAKKGAPTVKPRKGKCSYGYVNQLIQEVLDLRARFPSYRLASQYGAQLEQQEPTVQPISSKYEQPDKSKLVEDLCLRFNR